MPSIAVKGVDIDYEISGSGEPLMLVGGLELDRTRRTILAKELSKHFMVLTFDVDGGKTIEAMAEDMVAVMGALGITRADVLAGSLGALVAEAAAAKYPEKFNGLALFSVPMQPTLKGWLMMTMMGLPGDSPDKGMPDLSMQRKLNAVRKFDSWKAMKGIKAPTLIIHGNKDGLVPIRNAEEMAVNIGGARLVVLEGGHRFYMENTDAFILAVKNFFALTG